jgi:N-acetylglucosamine-6-sulfatase
VPRTRLPWRTVALVEHQHLNKANPNDPDFEDGKLGGNPTTYAAIRISSKHLPGFRGPVEAVYVEYKDPQHEIEYYNIPRDPYEQDNIGNKLTAAQRTELHRILVNLENCHDARACWKAALPS